MLLDNPILSRNAIGAKQDSANQYTVYEPNLNADGTSYRELVVSFDPVGRGPGTSLTDLLACSSNTTVQENRIIGVWPTTRTVWSGT